MPKVALPMSNCRINGHWLEYVDWANPVLQEPLRIEKGCALIPERPGAGIEWNEEAVARCLVA